MRRHGDHSYQESHYQRHNTGRTHRVAMDITLHNGFTIKTFVQGSQEPTWALLDTGAAANIIDLGFLLSIHPQAKNDIVFNSDQSSFKAANGGRIEKLGEIKIPLVIDSQYFKVTCSVVPNLIQEIILGMPFLNEHQATIDFARNRLYIPHSSERLLTTEKTKLPAYTETLLHVKLDGEPINGLNGIAKAGQFLLTKGLMVANGFTKVHKGQVTIKILNATPNDTKLRKGFRVGVLVYEPPVLTDKIVPLPSLQVNQVNTQQIPLNTTQSLKDNNSGHQQHLEQIVRDLAIDISQSNLTKAERNQFQELIAQNQDVFQGLDGKVGKTHLVSHEILLKDPNSPPFRLRPHRINPKLWPQLDQHITDMLDNGIIEPSNSAWSSPVILVAKKDGSYRLVVDFRKINNLIVDDAYNLPLIQDIFDKCGTMKPNYMSSLDMAQGYHQVPINPSSRQYTAFQTPNGALYQYKQLPMGLKTSPSVFERLVELVLRGMQYTSILCYLDDILVVSETFEEHMAHLAELFSRLRKAGLKLKGKKCFFFRQEVSFLGHILTKDGLKCDPFKTRVVKEYPTPHNLKTLRGFLGLCCYYRKFVPHFSEIARPLHNLTRKTVPFQWTPDCQQAMEKLKEALTTAPLLKYPDFSKNFTLFSDASASAFGYILSQDTNGVQFPVAYGGRATNPAESRYSATELEAAAVISGLKHFDMYLRHSKITIVTDHSALKQLFKTRQPTSPRVARWILALAAYDYEVETRPGRQVTHVDALSRRDYPKGHTEQDKEVIRKVYEDPPVIAACSRYLGHSLLNPIKAQSKNAGIGVKNTKNPVTPVLKPKRTQVLQQRLKEDPPSMEAIDETPNTKQELIEKQRADKDLAPIIQYLETGQLPIDPILARRVVANSADYAIIQKVLLHFWVTSGKGPVAQRLHEQIVLPQSMVQPTLETWHDSIYAGHQGFARTYYSIRMKFYWETMAKDINLWAKTCTECLQVKVPPRRHKPPLTPIEVKEPMALVHVDHLGPLKETPKGLKHILVVKDNFSGFVQLYPVKSTKALETATCMLNFVSSFGIPHQIHSDQGTSFTAALIKELFKLLNIKKSCSSPRYPQGNGKVESQMKIITQRLTHYTNLIGDDWADALPLIQYSINSTPGLDTTTFSPFFLMFLREPIFPQNHYVLPHNLHPPTTVEYIDQKLKDVELFYDIANESLNKHRAQMKNQFDKSARDHPLKIGDFVYLYVPDIKPGHNRKFKRPYVGPFLISRLVKAGNAQLRRVADGKLLSALVHVRRLKRALIRNPISTVEDIPVEPPKDWTEEPQEVPDLKEVDYLDEWAQEDPSIVDQQSQEVRIPLTGDEIPPLTQKQPHPQIVGLDKTKIDNLDPHNTKPKPQRQPRKPRPRRNSRLPKNKEVQSAQDQAQSDEEIIDDQKPSTSTAIKEDLPKKPFSRLQKKPQREIGTGRKVNTQQTTVTEGIPVKVKQADNTTAQHYLVKKVLKKRYFKNTSEPYYLLEWETPRGVKKLRPTWEPFSYLAPDLQKLVDSLDIPVLGKPQFLPNQ